MLLLVAGFNLAMIKIQHSHLEAESQEILPDAILTPPVSPGRLEKSLLAAFDIGGLAKDSIKKSTEMSLATGKRILLVEDNLINQKLAKLLLAKLKCKVEVAGNGQEALDKLADSKFDLVFMDCQMPVMDGYTASGKIRELQGDASKLPIVAMTANAMRGDREKCIEAGMDDYLSKPVQAEAIRDAIVRWTVEEPQEPSTESALDSVESS
jgi:CheY-like chemotaxis protein